MAEWPDMAHARYRALTNYYCVECFLQLRGQMARTAPTVNEKMQHRTPKLWPGAKAARGDPCVLILRYTLASNTPKIYNISCFLKAQ